MPIYKSKLLDKENFKVLKFSEFLRIIQNEYEERYNLLVFLYLTGIRPSEVGLIRENFKIDRKEIEVVIPTRKSGLKRLILIPICNYATEKLAKYIEKKFPKEYIFPRYATKKNVRQVFIYENIKNRCGLTIDGKFYPFSFYYFRHNLSTLIRMHGAEPFDIPTFFGKNLSFLFGSQAEYFHMNRFVAEKMKKILKKIMEE